MKHLSQTILLILLCCTLNSAYASPPSDDEINGKVDQIFSSLMSPFCAGKLLRDCTSGSAAELKVKVHERLLKGESVEEITQSLLALYGDEIRAAPRTRGFGVVAWITPFAFLGIAGIMLALWLRTRRRSAALAPAALPTALLPKEKELVEKALRE